MYISNYNFFDAPLEIPDQWRKESYQQEIKSEGRNEQIACHIISPTLPTMNQVFPIDRN
jgi:hypothetical protein